jgi:hypothetical protein
MACLNGLVVLDWDGGFVGNIDCVETIVCGLLVEGRGCVFADLSGKVAGVTLSGGKDAVYKFWVLFNGVEENGRTVCWWPVAGWASTSFLFYSASTSSSITFSVSSVSSSSFHLVYQE